MFSVWPKRNQFRKLKNLILTSIILIPITSTAILAKAEDTNFRTAQERKNAIDSIEKLPFCNEDNQRTINRRLLYVTTLDGKLSALDIANNGKLHWSVSTDPGPLISSSIHRLELTNNGQWVRMIPSLNGGLYKFDGETLDPIPITADNLLSSSFKFSDDLVISGGKETQTYGVSARTGQVLYKCSINGCVNETDSNNNFGPTDAGDDEAQYLDEHDPLIDDVLVVRRQTQTVRAVEPRTGSERWNFSVGYHEMEILKSPDCHNRPFSDIDLAVLDMEIRVVVPEGMVCGFSKQDPETILWKYKFDHPIVSAWKTDSSDQIQTIDLFRAAPWLWNGGDKNQEVLVTPSVYLGMYRKQLYIQESQWLAKQITDETRKDNNKHLVTSESKLPQIPWKPFPASGSALAVVISGHDDEKVIHEGEDEPNTAALSVLYASEYVNGNGFYLYSSTDLNKTETALCDSKNETHSHDDDFDFNFDEVDTPVKIIVISLWYWWKEIVVIALTTALIVNLILSPKIRREREFVVIEKHIPVPTASEATEEMFTGSRLSRRSISESGSTGSDNNFVSRFSTDFDLIQCLGRGGFGVVFEAKNKLDDCNYAVKRIVLPSKKESRDRVLREVKTLANCEHQNIVRYFQAWVESPPPGWQETEDKKLMSRSDLPSTSIDIETPDGTTLPSFGGKDTNFNDNIMENRAKKLESWITSLNGDHEIFDGQMIADLSAADRKDLDDSLSFIEFKEDSKIQARESTGCQRIIEEEEEGEESDSFEIEFQHSKRSENSEAGNEASRSRSNSTSQQQQYGRMRQMKRHMSLDLTSQGDVIVPIPEKCQQKVYLYIQMQLCRKQSLREWMREFAADKRHPHVRNIFEQIVGAVEYVHLKGLIHRDLKPSNIFFSLDGQVKIGDFGLVTDMSDSPSSTSSSDSENATFKFNTRRTQQVGTHLYMSPEQLEGRPYDFKVDIFSIGLIFYELLVDFGTEMERIVTLKNLRAGQFSDDFQKKFQAEYKLLRSMLAAAPTERPSTTEIKYLLSAVVIGNCTDNDRNLHSATNGNGIRISPNLEQVVRSSVQFGIADNE